MAQLSTRKQLRRRVGRLTGDMILCTATSAGTTTTFIDVLNLNHQGNMLDNRQGIFSGGTAGNLGDVIRVTDSDKTTQTITFVPTLSDATAQGDELELWNERDEGITPAVVHELINDAIYDAAGRSPVPITSDALSFAYDSNVIDIDLLEVSDVVSGNAWEGITGVDYQDPNEDWQKIDTPDLIVDRYARTITIIGTGRCNADGQNIRVRGANLPVALTTDADTTSVDYEWLTHHVSAQALGVRLEKAYERKEVEGNLLRLQARADQLRPKIDLRLRGRFWRLS